MRIQGEIPDEYARASSFLHVMNRFRRIWAGFHTAAPLRRSDMAMMGMLTELESRGDDKVTVSRLARVMNMSPPGVSQKLSMLEEAGFIRRKADKEDRRMATIELTPQGRQCAEDGLRNLLKDVDAALEKIGSDDAATLLRLMEKLSEAMEETMGEYTENRQEGGDAP